MTQIALHCALDIVVSSFDHLDFCLVLLITMGGTSDELPSSKLIFLFTKIRRHSLYRIAGWQVQLPYNDNMRSTLGFEISYKGILITLNMLVKL